MFEFNMEKIDKKKFLNILIAVLLIVFITLGAIIARSVINMKNRRNIANLENKKEKENENVEKKDDNILKNTTYLNDTTTEILVDDVVENKNDIKKIVKHGDHWHVFTKDGKEHITYTDPTKPTSKLDFDNMVSVVGLEKLKKLNVKRIKVHGNHWHVFTDTGKEYITYTDPTKIFHIKVEKYVASKRHTHPQVKPSTKKEEPKKDQKVKQDPNDPNRVVKILRHEDHWHVYTAAGEEFVVYEDPSAKYPDIKIGDFIKKDLPKVNKDEVFTYDEIEPKLIIPLEKLDYGGIIYTVGFDKEKNVFIVPHLDHFHNVSIETIIAFSKDKDVFFGLSPRDIVATLKYLVLNPDKRPKKEGWGDLHSSTSDKKEDQKETEEDEKVVDMKIQFLKKYYNIKDDMDIQRIGDVVYIYTVDEKKNDKTLKIKIDDLEVVNKEVKPKKGYVLPKINE